MEAKHRRNHLTTAEEANVLRALRFLRRRLGGNAKIARAIGVSEDAMAKAAVPSRSKSPRMAVLVARLAGVPVDKVLTGKWPPPGACAHCGRGC